MEVPPLNARSIDASTMPLERLASSKSVSESEKIAQASRAFEAVLLRQILSESQQPVFPSKFVGNSTADGIYRDEMVNQLADSISKSGSFGLGKSLAAELQRQNHASGASHVSGPTENARVQISGRHAAATDRAPSPRVSGKS